MMAAKLFKSMLLHRAKMYLMKVRPWQFRRLLCVATMSSLAQLRVQDGY